MKQRIIIAIIILSVLVTSIHAASTVITMQDGDIVELVCENRIVSNLPDRVQVECVDAVIATVTPTNTAPPPPTETAVPPTVTPSLIPTVTGTAVSTSTPAPITGCVGVIGDSASYPREWIGTWGVSWVEFANWERGVDFGPYLSGYSCNRSYPGNKVSNIDGQIGSLAGYINNVGIVIIFIGANDLAPMCNSHYTTSQYNALKSEMLTELEGGIVDLVGYGMVPNDIYMVTQADRTQELSCSNAAQFRQMVGELNATIDTWDSEHGVNIINIQSAYDELATYGSLTGNMVINGHTIYYDMCDAPSCKFVSDGHHNTAFTILMFNALFADVLQVAPANDSEIATFSGLN